MPCTHTSSYYFFFSLCKCSIIITTSILWHETKRQNKRKMNLIITLHRLKIMQKICYSLNRLQTSEIHWNIEKINGLPPYDDEIQKQFNMENQCCCIFDDEQTNRIQINYHLIQCSFICWCVRVLCEAVNLFFFIIIVASILLIVNHIYSK